MSISKNLNLKHRDMANIRKTIKTVQFKFC